MEDKGIVHALSEYKPQLADVTTPPMEDTSGALFTTSREDECGDMVMAPEVISDKNIPIMTNAATAVIIGILRLDLADLVVATGHFLSDAVAVVVIGVDAVVVIGVGSFCINAVAVVVIGVGSFCINDTGAVFFGSFRLDVNDFWRTL